MSFHLPSFIAIVLSYLLGSLSFAVIVSRFMGLSDPRTYGSENPGATNVLRTGRKGLAAATLLLDLLKGAAAVLLVALNLRPAITSVGPLLDRIRDGVGASAAWAASPSSS